MSIDIAPIWADTPFWHNNLAALRTRQPKLARRLESATIGKHVRVEHGRLELQHRDHWHDLSAAPPAVAWSGNSTAQIFGIGAGQALFQALSAGCSSVVVWDRDPTLFRAVLAAYDVSSELRSGRLKLALGVDLIALKEGSPWFIEPLIGEIYAWERGYLAQPAGRRALVATGTLFVDDIAHALYAEGYTVFPLAAAIHTIEELGRTVADFRPEVVFAVNYLHGLAEFCAERRVPFRCWEIDPATDRVKPIKTRGNSCIFSYRFGNVAHWRTTGLKSEYLPLATNPERRTPRNPALAERPPSGIAFVGASMAQTAQTYLSELRRLAGQRDNDAQRVHATLAAILNEQGAQTAYVADKLLESVYPNLPTERHEPKMLIGEVAASEHRLNTVARLADLGMEVWGDTGWKLTEAKGVHYRGPAGHFHQLNDVYRNTLVNVDIGRLYQPDIVPMRVFDVLACGGFVLAAHSEALPELFTIGQELDSWRTVEELYEKARWYLLNPNVTLAMAQRGRARVLADHTIRARVRMMLAYH